MTIEPGRRREKRDDRSWSASLGARLRGLLDRFADAPVGPAAADVAGHRIVDVGIGGTRVAREQRRGGHDLARLAVAALHDLAVEPGLLDPGAGRGRTDRLDRGDRGAADAVDGGDAGADGDAVDMHGAGAAQRQAAAELGAGHAEHVAQHPEERRVAVDIDAVGAAVDFDGEGHGVLLSAGTRPVQLRSILPDIPDFASLIRATNWRAAYRSCHSAVREASNKNQVRRSASSIQFSNTLAVAISPCSSQRPCVSRNLSVSRLLSSRNSASMSIGVTKSASLSRIRCKRAMWPIERSVVPPILRTRSAIASVAPKIWSLCSSSERW